MKIHVLCIYTEINGPVPFKISKKLTNVLKVVYNKSKNISLNNAVPTSEQLTIAEPQCLQNLLWKKIPAISSKIVLKFTDFCMRFKMIFKKECFENRSISLTAQ